MKNSLLTLAGALALAATLATDFAAPLVAQVRAAIVKNIDEPARSPYFYERSTAGPSGSNVVFPAVPAGKRLRLTRVAGLCLCPAGTRHVSLYRPNDGGIRQEIFPTTTLPFGNGLSQNVDVYYEAGQSPKLDYLGTNADSFQIVLTGYFVDLNQ